MSSPRVLLDLLCGSIDVSKDFNLANFIGTNAAVPHRIAPTGKAPSSDASPGSSRAPPVKQAIRRLNATEDFAEDGDTVSGPPTKATAASAPWYKVEVKKPAQKEAKNSKKDKKKNKKKKPTDEEPEPESPSDGRDDGDDDDDHPEPEGEAAGSSARKPMKRPGGGKPCRILNSMLCCWVLTLA